MLFRSNDTATTEIYTLDHTLSLHDALPIYDAMDASSILSLMSLGAANGQVVVLRAEGDGADEALAGLVKILETDLDAE